MGNTRSYSRPRRRRHCGHRSPSITGDSGRGYSSAVTSRRRRRRHPSPRRTGRGRRCRPRASSWHHRRRRIALSCGRCSPHLQAPVRAPPPSPPSTSSDRGIQFGGTERSVHREMGSLLGFGSNCPKSHGLGACRPGRCRTGLGCPAWLAWPWALPCWAGLCIAAGLGAVVC